MTRIEASQLLRTELDKHGLNDWHVRLNQNPESKFLGLCSYKDKCIILSAHHIDIHPSPDVKNTVLHEVAHALTPGHQHDDVWAAKAREIGCDNTLPCSSLSLSPELIDAIRSGADVQVTFDEHIVRTPKYTVTRLQDKCEYCGKVAKVKKEKILKEKNEDKPDLKFIYYECGHSVIRKIPKGTPFHKLQYGGDPACEHSWNKNKCLSCGRFRPFDFQIEGMKFAEAALTTGKGVAILDEMGLGKTIQAGGVVKFHPELCDPTLWVVKSGLKYQFAGFHQDWLDEIPQVIETSKDYLIPKVYKHYIIGYDMLVKKTRTIKSTGTKVESGFDIRKFDHIGGKYDKATDTWTGGYPIKCVVLDECQQIKNADSSRTQMVRRLVKDRKVIGLSGTPWKNRGSEFFPLLNMIDPAKFYSAEKFVRDWVATYWSGNQIKEGGIKNVKQFKEFTKNICIRRERAEVMPELPKTNRTKLFVKMDPNDQKVYDVAVDAFVKWWESQTDEISGMAIIAAMARMRHIVALAKIPATMEYIDDFVADTDKKIVIFAHHDGAQQILYDKCKTAYGHLMPVLHIAGGMASLKRNEIQNEFNNSPRAILIASQLAAGEGLNLQTCSDCIMHERQWNPANEEQCEGRFTRPGSTAAFVSAIYTEMQGLTTIDPQLDGIVENKRHYFHTSMNKGEAPVWNQDALLKELAEVIVRAHKSKKAA